jgi:methionyl-tRNA synthetase
MVHKYFEGVVPTISQFKFEAEFDAMFKVYCAEIEQFDLKKAVEAVLVFLTSLNQYVEESKPWELAKNNDLENLELVMANLVEGVRRANYLLNPYIPKATETLAGILGVDLSINFTEAFEGILLSGKKLQEIQPLFPRV